MASRVALLPGTPTRPNPPPSRQASSASATPPSRIDSHPSQHTAISEGSSPESQADQYLFLSRFIHRNEIPQADLWLRDLELLHFWTTEAYEELTHRSDICHMWRVDAPKYAVSHPYLMHEMLAFAAFSKADKQQQQELCHEYYTFGIHHQDCAIRGLRRNIAATTPQEAAAMVATSTLLTLSVFASLGLEAEHNMSATPPCVIEGLLNCFYLMQGMGNILSLTQATIVDSFLRPLVSDPTEVTPSQPLLMELLQQTPALVSFIRDKHDLPESERATYLTTVAHFDPALSISLPPKVDNRELRFLFIWPLHINVEFMSLLQQRRPGALVILMHYATVLLAAEPRYWFMKNWGQRVLKACHESIDQSWLPAIQWPLSFLNSNSTFDLFTNLMRRQNSAATPGGVLYPQRRAPDVAYRQTHPGQSVPNEMSDHSSPGHKFMVTSAEQDKTPKVNMGSNTVDHED
ncbi:hypothetical protein COCSADRAFT_160037 [Bipolaris sorokiniana ND90Pr]|uniref:Transcription factor domain-containing protein n=1 Tax=Cochliobolus sativus (strain ND90Pr / ATCC 201652) TaxID=665912 RepID=M2RE58_COCSN|nr:uncharacterized protein COCSADRAFT_160037 [Bipolaris sorokiniana ND90Pr]EMD65049.1 hypothetical protein COCSADRAFT_160037 [Bipolaris sorokiniana ND90Pr]